MTFSDAKQRFTIRVADYVRYRPGYPLELLPLLRTWCHLLPTHSVADVGSGTGLLSKVFLDQGNQVFGVEPNARMRAAGEEFLRSFKNFTSIAGSAESTSLPEDSVDFVTAGQAFHWFDLEPTRREFQRILKPQGRAILIWNERILDETAFLRDYESLLKRYGTDYSRVSESYPRAEQLLAFFEPNEFTSHVLPNFQEFDFAGLSGRLRSSSYAPPEGHPHHEPMHAELEQVFAAHQKHGHVRMEYRTRVYTGKLDLNRINA